MKTKKMFKLFLVAAMFTALVASGADAKGKPGSGGGGGGTPTNYGCQTFSAGKVFRSPDGLTTKTLLMSTYTCYLCNMTTHVCTCQSPASLVGWTFIF